LGDALEFAINQRLVSRDASSIAQTDVQHFADEEVMRNSRASLAEVARSTGFADQHHLARVFRRIAGITPSTLMAIALFSLAATSPRSPLTLF
jgi:AraC-like DNA-binding protein